MEQATVDIEKAQGQLDLILARSNFLDAFAELESLISRIALSCGKVPTNGPFGARVQAFRTAEKTNMICKSNLHLRDPIADEISLLLGVRADIVHSAMRVADLDGVPTALFVSAQEANQQCPPSRVISMRDFRVLILQIRSIAERIRKLSKSPEKPATSTQPVQAAVTTQG